MGSTEDKMQQIIGLLLYGDMTFTLAATHLDLTRQKDKQPRDKMYPLLNLTEEAPIGVGSLPLGIYGLRSMQVLTLPCVIRSAYTYSYSE
jgi:hypothetical protein